MAECLGCDSCAHPTVAGDFYFFDVANDVFVCHLCYLLRRTRANSVITFAGVVTREQEALRPALGKTASKYEFAAMDEVDGLAPQRTSAVAAHATVTVRNVTHVRDSADGRDTSRVLSRFSVGLFPPTTPRPRAAPPMLIPEVAPPNAHRRRVLAGVLAHTVDWLTTALEAELGPPPATEPRKQVAKGRGKRQPPAKRRLLPPQQADEEEEEYDAAADPCGARRHRHMTPFALHVVSAGFESNGKQWLARAAVARNYGYFVENEHLTYLACLAHALEHDRTDTVSWLLAGAELLFDAEWSNPLGDAENTAETCVGMNMRDYRVRAHSVRPADAAVPFPRVHRDAGSGRHIRVSGGNHSARDCFINAVSCDPELAPAWFALSECIEPGSAETICVQGVPYTREQLGALAVQCDAKAGTFGGFVWQSIASMLHADENNGVEAPVFMLDGKRYTAYDAAKAACLLPSPRTWKARLITADLCRDLPATWPELPPNIDGRDFPVTLALSAAEVFPSVGSYLTLALMLDICGDRGMAFFPHPDDPTQALRAQWCFEVAFTLAIAPDGKTPALLHPLDPIGDRLAAAWLSMASRCRRMADFTVRTTVLTPKDCVVWAIRADPHVPRGWYQLGVTLTPGEVVMVDRRTYSRQGCFLKQLREDPACVDAWVELGNNMPLRETVSLSRGILLAAAPWRLPASMLPTATGRGDADDDAWLALSDIGDAVFVEQRALNDRANARLGEDEEAARQSMRESLDKDEATRYTAHEPQEESAFGIDNSHRRSAPSHRALLFSPAACIGTGVQYGRTYPKVWGSLAGRLGAPDASATDDDVTVIPVAAKEKKPAGKTVQNGQSISAGESLVVAAAATLAKRFEPRTRDSRMPTTVVACLGRRKNATGGDEVSVGRDDALLRLRSLVMFDGDDSGDDDGVEGSGWMGGTF
jgi:hypothetical protein